METMKYPLEEGYLSRQYKVFDQDAGEEKLKLLDEMQNTLNRVFEASRENRKAEGLNVQASFENVEMIAADMLMQHFYNLIGQAAAAGEKAGQEGTASAIIRYHSDGKIEVCAC